MEKFQAWAEENGVWHKKLIYPVAFGEEGSEYIGALAAEEIGPNEILVKTPGKLIISAYNGYTDPVLS